MRNPLFDAQLNSGRPVQVHGATGLHLRLHLPAGAMALRPRVHQRQATAHPGKLALPVHALKQLSQALRTAGMEAVRV